MPERSFGWNHNWNAAFADFRDACLPARVIRVDRGECTVRDVFNDTERRVQTHHSVSVGDWIAIDADSHSMVALLPRKSSIARNAAGGETVEQILAANIDIAFIVCSLEVKLNLRRIDRWLVMSWQNGITPVIVLSKSDLAGDKLDELLADVRRSTLGVDVIAVNTMEDGGMYSLAAYMQDGTTAVLLGQSGVGKSTIVNFLQQSDVLKTQETRGDGKGLHTTTHRELVELENGSMLIDTPGIRGLLLWDSEEGLANAFADVEQFVERCRFNDCLHATEPGCAVIEAIDKGHLEHQRLVSYRKLQREAAWLERKQDKRAQSEQQRVWRTMSKNQRAYPKLRRK